MPDALVPPPEFAHFQYHFLIDTRFTSSDGKPSFEPMLWHNGLWYRIGGVSSLLATQSHHWRYHHPCDPSAVTLASVEKIEKALRFAHEFITEELKVRVDSHRVGGRLDTTDEAGIEIIGNAVECLASIDIARAVIAALKEGT